MTITEVEDIFADLQPEGVVNMHEEVGMLIVWAGERCSHPLEFITFKE